MPQGRRITEDQVTAMAHAAERLAQSNPEAAVIARAVGQRAFRQRMLSLTAAIIVSVAVLFAVTILLAVAVLLFRAIAGV
jgi:hypothetical protein